MTNEERSPSRDDRQTGNAEPLVVSLVNLDELLTAIEDPVTLSAPLLPWQTHPPVLNSPRSLQACRACGIDPHVDLRKYSLKYFARLRDKGAQQLAWHRFQRHQHKREALMRELTQVRQQIIDGELQVAAAPKRDDSAKPGAGAFQRSTSSSASGGYFTLTPRQLAHEDRIVAAALRKQLLEDHQAQLILAKASTSDQAIDEATRRRAALLQHKTGRAAVSGTSLTARMEAAQSRRQQMEALRRSSPPRHAHDGAIATARSRRLTTLAAKRASDTEVRIEAAQYRRLTLEQHALELSRAAVAKREARERDIAAKQAWLRGDARECADYNMTRQEEVQRRKALIEEMERERRTAPRSASQSPIASARRSVTPPASVRRTAPVDEAVAAAAVRRAAIEAELQRRQAEAANAARQRSGATGGAEVSLAALLKAEAAREKEEDRRTAATRRKRAIEYMENIRLGFAA